MNRTKMLALAGLALVVAVGLQLRSHSEPERRPPQIAKPVVTVKPATSHLPYRYDDGQKAPREATLKGSLPKSQKPTTRLRPTSFAAALPGKATAAPEVFPPIGDLQRPAEVLSDRQAMLLTSHHGQASASRGPVFKRRPVAAIAKRKPVRRALKAAGRFIAKRFCCRR